jgi:hypothetical protein
MPRYLIESYLSRTHAAELAPTRDRARWAAEAMCKEGILVRHVRSTFLAEDEVCLHLFEAPTAGAAREVSRRAEIEFDRIVEAVE